MKLSIIEQGHWTVVPNYPGSMINKKSKERLSFLLDPSDRDKFINWSKGKKNAKKNKKKQGK